MRVPVVNAPRAVAATGRVANAARLARLTAVIAPRARTMRRDAPPAGPFPLILRAPGLHMGRGMIRVESPQAFGDAARSLPERQELIAIDYVDTRSPDGAWRKCRVMT